MGKKVSFDKEDAGKIHEYLKSQGIPVRSVTAGGGIIEVELEDTATEQDEANLRNEMRKMGWL